MVRELALHLLDSLELWVFQKRRHRYITYCTDKPELVSIRMSLWNASLSDSERACKVLYTALQDSPNSVTPPLRYAVRQYLALPQYGSLECVMSCARKVLPCVGLTYMDWYNLFKIAPILCLSSVFLLLHSNPCF